MSTKVNLFLFAFLLASISVAWAVSGNDNTNSLQTVIIGQVRAHLADGNSSVIQNDEPPCDQTENACMDWCGEVVRRPGRCPNNQMCCVLIY